LNQCVERRAAFHHLPSAEIRWPGRDQHPRITSRADHRAIFNASIPAAITLASAPCAILTATPSIAS
jgi:hypothetical protein